MMPKEPRVIVAGKGSSLRDVDIICVLMQAVGDFATRKVWVGSMNSKNGT